MSLMSVILLCVVVAIAVFYTARFLFRVDERTEERRRAAAKLAGVLSSNGLVRIPDLLVDYSVGDYSGMGEHVIEVTRLFLSGETAVMEEFDKVFSNILTAKLRTAEGRAYVAAMLAGADGQEAA